MNRKLRNTILAFSVTGTALALGLMVARPAPLADGSEPAVAAASASPARPAPQGMTAAPDQAGEASGPLTDPAPSGHPARSDAAGDAFEGGLVGVATLEEAVVTTAGLAAVAGAEAVIAGLADAPSAGAWRVVRAEADPGARRGHGHVRRAVAVPYFSFARGAGRGSRS